MSIDRKIDVDKLTDEQLEKAIETIGDAIRNDVDALCEKHNKTLNRYGLKCAFQFHVIPESD